MRLAKPDDIVLHLIDNKNIVGISKVKESSESNRGFTYRRKDKDGEIEVPGYLVKLTDYIQFESPISVRKLLDMSDKTTLLDIINNEGNVFYNRNLGLNEGAYLTSVPNSLMNLINDFYRSNNGKDLPYWKDAKTISLALLGPTDEKYIETLKKAIDEKRSVPDTWSYIVAEEKIKILQNTKPFYIYCYITKRSGGTGLVEYKLRVTDVHFAKEKIPNPFDDTESLVPTDTARSWYLFDKVEKIDPPHKLEEYFTYDTEEPIDPIAFQRVRNPNTEFFYIIEGKLASQQATKFEKSNPQWEKMSGLLEKKKQIILYGPPGTGKTYIARNFSEWLLKKSYQDLNETQQVTFITFHPSYSYEEFVEGITANTENGPGDIQYIRKWGIFKRICTFALASAMNISIDFQKACWADQWNTIYMQYAGLAKEEKDKLWKNAPNQILIIDEINRGDISKIFGELITLLEADKRLNQENEIKVSLPYSNDVFCVPPNLYIIATMNTADRSIALIDVALRRRFGFVELSPKLQELQTTYLIENQANLKAAGVYEALEKSITVLIKINANIIQALGRDKQIGQSFFFKVHTPDDLVMVWEHELLPLIEEYFYCDYSKIGQILEIKKENPFLNENVGIKGFKDFSELIKFLDTIGEQETDNA
jgi:5-methylcytosine-specific restriction protein B